MEAFGSTKFPAPFLATAAAINGAKGKIMGLNAPFSIATIEKFAAAAVEADSDEAVNKLLTPVRIVSFSFRHWERYRMRWLTTY
jgi:hypothetical protein